MASPGSFPLAPASAGELAPSSYFVCTSLHCLLRAAVCARRQAVSERQLTTQLSRGQGTEYPSCDSRTCRQGRQIRRALERTGGRVHWEGAGPGHRFASTHSAPSLAAARARLAAVGLLGLVPTIDGPPGDVGEADAAGLG